MWCYFLLFPWLSKKLSLLPNLELNSLLSRFDGSVRTKKSMNGVYKTNIDCSFIREMVENYCSLGKILFTSALRASVNSRPGLSFHLGTIIFHHSPHEQSIFVYYLKGIQESIAHKICYYTLCIVYKSRVSQILACGAKSAPPTLHVCPEVNFKIHTNILWDCTYMACGHLSLNPWAQPSLALHGPSWPSMAHQEI